MRNHFLRASGTAATGGDGGGGDGGGGGATCGANDSGGTNEWTLIAAKTDGLFASQHEFTSSIDTTNKISYLATFKTIAATGKVKLVVRKITNTGTISWTKKLAFSGTDYTEFLAFKGKSLSTGKQIIAGMVQYGNTYGTCFLCINADGTVEWCKRVTPFSSSSYLIGPYRLIVDSSDNIYCAFYQQEPNSSGGASSTAYFFIIKLNSSGVIQWQKRFRQGYQTGGTIGFVSSFTNVQGIEVDSNYVYVLNTRNNQKSIQIVTLNVSNGAYNTTRWLGSSSSSEKTTYYHRRRSGSQIVKDSSGDFYILYPVKGSNTYNEIIIVKFNSSYTVSWSTKLTFASGYTFYRQGGFALTVTPNIKNVVLSCKYYYNSNYGHLIAVLDSSGSLSWHRIIENVEGQTNGQTCNGLEADNADHFYRTGNLPWTTSNASYTNQGEAILKHTTCSAIPANTYISTFDPNNRLSSISGSPSGFGQVKDTSIISASSGSAEIVSSAPSYDILFGNYYEVADPAYNFTMTSETATLTDLSSSEDFKVLDYI